MLFASSARFLVARVVFGALIVTSALRAQNSAPTRSIDGDRASAPIVWRGLEPAVDVMIGSKGPYRFAIDTGASGDARADTSLVTALSLEKIGEARGSSGGAVQTMPIVLLPELTLGGITWRNLAAPSRDYNGDATLPRVDGIFGGQAFADYLLTLDFPNARLSVTRGALEAGGAGVIDADFSRRVPQIAINLAGTTVDAVIDTGNTTTELLTVPAAMAKTLPLVAPPTPAGSAATVSGLSQAMTAELNGTVTVAGVTLTHPRLLFLDGSPTVNIGSAFLRTFALTIDQKNRRVRFVAAPTLPSPGVVR